MSNYTVKKLKNNLRNGYAWPGGYEIFYLTSDGELLCGKCVRENFRSVIWSMKNNVSDGWEVVASCVEFVSPDCCPDEIIGNCAHCYKQIGECV